MRHKAHTNFCLSMQYEMIGEAMILDSVRMFGSNRMLLAVGLFKVKSPLCISRR